MSSGSLKCSSSRSCTHMPPMRSSSRMSRRPRRRIRQPSPSSAARSRQLGAQPRRRLRQQRMQRAREALQLRTPDRQRRGVCADWSARAPRRAGPSVQVRHPAPERRSAVLGGERQSVRRQRADRDQRSGHQMQQVRAGRDAKAGRELARDGRPAHAVRRLEHQHRAAGARQIGRADQAVVTGADDDAVVGCGAHCEPPEIAQDRVGRVGARARP